MVLDAVLTMHTAHHPTVLVDQGALFKHGPPDQGTGALAALDDSLYRDAEYKPGGPIFSHWQDVSSFFPFTNKGKPAPPGTILPGQLLFNPKGNASGYRALMEFIDKGGNDMPNMLKAWLPVGKTVNASNGAVRPGANRMVGFAIDWGQEIPNGPSDHVGWIHTGKQTSVGLPASPRERILGGNHVDNENAEQEIHEEESTR
eukprot:GEMP01069728.1.p1 GENE.GEMP01069728.1~~GEMP01069728.1.p1  ORF type:complete len:202 (+),score=41.33 GEMP01069728.1:103-708(+)